MHRSGLALAGAQATLEAWKRGEAPAVANDGVVTAEDVAALHLRGTWLVTLSACDTGAGEAKAGEGVMGLRRGFMEAGTQNMLMTLWPISDETTVEIMTDLYEFSGQPVRESLRIIVSELSSGQKGQYRKRRQCKIICGITS